MENYITFFENILTTHIGSHIKLHHHKSVSGGCISNAFLLETSSGPFFIKYNPADHAAHMFEVEQKGLALLQATQAVRVAHVIATGVMDNVAYILMDYEASALRSPQFWKNFGVRLAKMHKFTHTHYGLDHDNYIGALFQKNEYKDSWVEFFIENRLQMQVKKAMDKQLISISVADDFESLYQKLPDMLPESMPSLVHGDMWSGNVMVGGDGQVFLIDPAVYYADREIEIAFTKLFGGFDQSFYDSYYSEYPLQPGYIEREDIYNLYPLMVHVNLFGTSYLSGILNALKRFVS